METEKDWGELSKLAAGSRSWAQAFLLGSLTCGEEGQPSGPSTRPVLPPPACLSPLPGLRGRALWFFIPPSCKLKGFMK